MEEEPQEVMKYDKKDELQSIGEVYAPDAIRHFYEKKGITVSKIKNEEGNRADKLGFDFTVYYEDGKKFDLWQLKSRNVEGIKNPSIFIGEKKSSGYNLLENNKSDYLVRIIINMLTKQPVRIDTIDFSGMKLDMLTNRNTLEPQKSIYYLPDSVIELMKERGWDGTRGWQVQLAWLRKTGYLVDEWSMNEGWRTSSKNLFEL